MKSDVRSCCITIRSFLCGVLPVLSSFCVQLLISAVARRSSSQSLRNEFELSPSLDWGEAFRVCVWLELFFP